MGIPSFYRWLSNTFPNSIVPVKEKYPFTTGGAKIPVDTTEKNPNGIEFDNLYLDMNNIVHPCFHPESLPPQKSYEEVLKAVFVYIDRIFSMIRPRKLLYMAIDGVAPRAKMNQQRARRFRAAKDAAQEAPGTNILTDNLAEERGLDSNFITPGTEFMELLSSALQYYIHDRINHDPGWKQIKVVLSDASVPGEGEHKIMSYIRLQRNLPGYNPNTRHCLYGLDADLILLALATHEVHFSVLREVRIGKKRKEKIGKVCCHTPPGRPLRDMENFISKLRFQFINLWVLRDGLEKSLRIQNRKVEVDLERLIDDFVFLCIFVGNDFLPHLPLLEISEGAMSILLRTYKCEFVRMGGYVVDSFEVNLERVEHLLRHVGLREDAMFKKKSKRKMTSKIGLGGISGNSNESTGEKNVIALHDIESIATTVADKVIPGRGRKERYYAEKFGVHTDEELEEIKKHAVMKYVEGISWVMHYYYKGVCSWQWFYPHHYAPFASDFHGLDQIKIQFALGKPFKPLSQLMAVLPAASGQALPLSYRKLMIDSSSPILDFYPTDFELDMDDNKPVWQAICKLPFIDECRLVNEIAKLQHTLTDVEKRRNSLGLDKLFFHKFHPLAAKIFAFSKRNQDNPKLHKAKVKRKINPKTSGGMNGYIYISQNPICPAEIPSPLSGMKTLVKNEVLHVFYKLPTFHSHIPRPPDGVKMPKMFQQCQSVRKHKVMGNAQGKFSQRKPPLKSRSSQPYVTDPLSTCKFPLATGPSPADDHLSVDGYSTINAPLSISEHPSDRSGYFITEPLSLNTSLKRRKLNENATSHQPSLLHNSSTSAHLLVSESPSATSLLVTDHPSGSTIDSFKKSRKKMFGRKRKRLNEQTKVKHPSTCSGTLVTEASSTPTDEGPKKSKLSLSG